MTKPRPPEELVPPSELSGWFSYSDGALFWARKPNRNIVLGARAGTVSQGLGGYRVVRLMGSAYMEHRVIWAMLNGRWPADQLDHINHDRTDNRIENLREATPSQNALNRVKPVVGYVFNQGAYEVWCNRKYMGRYRTQVQASRAFQFAAQIMRNEP